MNKLKSSRFLKSPLIRAFVQLIILFLAQLFLMWLIRQLYPPVACGAYAPNSCLPQTTTEAMMLQLFLPVIFIPFGIMRFKQIVMYAGALTVVKKLAVIVFSFSLLLVMFWQLVVAIGSVVDRWFG